ncbi:DUF6612 family protein [Paenibacillus camelliae]|uniref:DUF6612 family protein n=1 Tax=Paenibacillus camelliae TaxID=512410 RepID=UPI00203E5D24|nr:DUF6612 family protein [Paenibacillus camelliae]MCM3633982.1 hypothetical protein [Paenibacillus camelliae]
MKKTLLAMLLVMALTLLAACGEGNKEPANSNSQTTGSQVEQITEEETDPVAEETPDAEVNEEANSDADKELFVAVVGEANNLNSFTVKMTADQTIDMDGEVMETKTVSDMDVTMKPALAFKQLTTVEAAGETQVIDSYFTEDGFFVKEPTAGVWMKLPAEMMDQVLQGVNQESLDPSAQLAQLVDYSESFAVEEKDGNYIFTLNAKGEEFNNLLAEQLGDQAAMLGDFEVNAAEYVIVVEKSSNKLISMDVFTDMKFQAEGQNLAIVSTVTTDYSNHNGIEAIELPEEALNAQEIEM